MGYSKEYYVEHGYGADPLRAEMYRQERARLLAYKQSGVILDVGCGIGDFLAGFGDNWRKFGIEPSQYAAELAYKQGVELIREIGDIGLKTVDLLVYRGTIQHIDSPFSSIQAAIRALKEDGLLVFLATPNADSLCYRLFGDLPALDPPNNFWIPSARTLSNVIRNAGGEVIRVEYPYRDTPYAMPMLDYWRFIGRLFGRKRKFPFPGNMMEVYAVRN